VSKAGARVSGIPSAVSSLAGDSAGPDPQLVGKDGPAAGDKTLVRQKAGDKPWANSRFWVLQLVILALYLIRLAATVAFHLDASSQAVEFSTLAIFLVPVVYAALNYGLRGALFTAGWVTLLAIPRFFSAIGDRDYVAAWAELAQVVLLDALAFLVGQRVTAERGARRIAETAQEAHLSAEALYRDLFDSNQAPILIVDGNGNVVETNASAQRAFAGATGRDGTEPGQPHHPALPVRLVDMIGPVASGHVLTRLISEQLPESTSEEEPAADAERVEPVTFEVEGQPVLYRPTATMLGRSDDGTRMQIVFEDVTAETRRHDLMEAYAARVVSGQEEERRHIAQELHDGPVQTLIHLCRQIDTVESQTDPAIDGALKLADLRAIVEDTVAELRSIAKGLRPSVLDDLGLVASINQILSEAGERHQFEISFGVTGPERRLAPTVELTLFRIAQEAISNIERHAAAQRVAVGLNFEELGLRLLVKDDGVGFDVRDNPEGINSETLGLSGMTERANLIGSRIFIHSERESGTTVDVWVPATILDKI
jgi:signal transduction histidine kinase